MDRKPTPGLPRNPCASSISYLQPLLSLSILAIRTRQSRRLRRIYRASRSEVVRGWASCAGILDGFFLSVQNGSCRFGILLVFTSRVGCGQQVWVARLGLNCRKPRGRRSSRTIARRDRGGFHEGIFHLARCQRSHRSQIGNTTARGRNNERRHRSLVRWRLEDEQSVIFARRQVAGDRLSPNLGDESFNELRTIFGRRNNSVEAVLGEAGLGNESCHVIHSRSGFDSPAVEVGPSWTLLSNQRRWAPRKRSNTP